ncbi:MAG: Cbb3-type cytochrome oxidase component FixQ [Bacteroidetes bacterium]|jgi:cytochrome c oxidase cbb3-type subunit 3|nr:Cbb3-type cytochrome oxidase component FixQ [Bacteroidota bacterium]
MKFINYLESMTGIGVYPLVSLMIFFVFFIGVGLFVILGRKEYFATLSHLPFSDDTTEPLTTNTSAYVEPGK